MVKSVRRKNIRRDSRRSRIETRNQRINRLNRSRKKRKGRNSLLNKKKRRVSRRKSNRRGNNKMRRSKRRIGGTPIGVRYACDNAPVCDKTFWAWNAVDAANKAASCTNKPGCPGYIEGTSENLE